MRRPERANATLGTKAVKSIVGVPKEGSDRAETEFQKVYELNREGKYDESLKVILKDDESVRSIFETDKNHALYCAGDIFFKKGNFTRAIRFFSEALRSRPDDIEALFALGNAYSQNGFHKEASSCFFVLSIISERNGDALFNYAGELMDMGEYSHALHVLSSIKEKNAHIRKNTKICVSKIRSL